VWPPEPSTLKLQHEPERPVVPDFQALLIYAGGMNVNGPRDLPDLRLELLHNWRPGGPFRQASAVINPAMARSTHLGPTFSHMDSTFDSRALEDASLWYVTADMSQLVGSAATSLPPTTLTPELLPSKCGLAVFATPLTGMSADETTIDAVMGVPLDEQVPPHSPVEVHALLWGDSETIKVRVDRREYVGIAIYRAVEDNGSQMWVPLGRTDWIYGDDTEEPTDPALVGHDLRLASMAEDRRWMACLWLLASQKRVGEQTVIPPDRAARRRSAREGRSAEVRLIDVRHKAEAAAGDGEGRAVEWSHRWLVSPHWRQQAYGPGRTLRRPVFIPPHIKGPQDKPLVVKPSVNVVRP
jgi:hypothetical protein